MRFQTNFRYSDRYSKAKYLWLKYQSILQGSILDVGADERYLKQYLPQDTVYWGIGLGGRPDQIVDLEKSKIPFVDNAFDCVICLDVLEHLNNIHTTFDELCRVTRKYVIIALPNPWASLFQALIFGDYEENRPLKYYGLPPEPPLDRHKWFYSNIEAQYFIEYRAKKNNMHVIQMDNACAMRLPRRLFFSLVRLTLPRINRNSADLYGGSLWAVLKKKGCA